MSEQIEPKHKNFWCKITIIIQFWPAWKQSVSVSTFRIRYKAGLVCRITFDILVYITQWLSFYCILKRWNLDTHSKFLSLRLLFKVSYVSYGFQHVTSMGSFHNRFSLLLSYAVLQLCYTRLTYKLININSFKEKVSWNGSLTFEQKITLSHWPVRT